MTGNQESSYQSHGRKITNKTTRKKFPAALQHDPLCYCIMMLICMSVNCGGVWRGGMTDLRSTAIFRIETYETSIVTLNADVKACMATVPVP